MSGLTIKFENSFTAGNTSLPEGTAKIYAFTGSPIDAYTKFTFSIHNGGPTLTGIRQIDLTFPKNILASDLSDNNFALLSGVLKAAFPGSTIQLNTIGNQAIFKVTFDSLLKITRNERHTFTINRLYANNLSRVSTALSVRLRDMNLTELQTTSFNFVLDKSQIPTPTITNTNPVPQSNGITEDCFSFGILGNSYIMNIPQSEQTIDFYMNVNASPLVIANGAGMESSIMVGFYTNDSTANPEPLQDSLYIDSSNGLAANYSLEYLGQNNINAVTKTDSVFAADDNGSKTNLNISVPYSLRAQYRFAKMIISSTNTNLSGWYRFRLTIKLTNDINYGIVKLIIQLKFGETNLSYELPISVAPFNIVDGNLGLGTVKPSKKLDVTGDAHITGITTLDGMVGIGNPNPSKKLDVFGDAHITGSTSIDGNLNIGTAIIKFTNRIAKKLLCLYETVANDHQYYGFGINANELNYQVDSENSSHVFYAGKDANNSKELARISGNGAGKLAELKVSGRIKDQTGFVMPVGSIIEYVGVNVPEGWLLCDGRNIVFGELYSDLRTALNNASNVPDLRAKFINMPPYYALTYIIKY